MKPVLSDKDYELIHSSLLFQTEQMRKEIGVEKFPEKIMEILNEASEARYRLMLRIEDYLAKAKK